MRHLLHPPAAWRDLALLLARVVLGVVLVAHGWQKVNEWGLDGTSASFEKMGVPAPTLSAWFAAAVELGGGVLLVLGALTPLVALLVVANMAGAFWFVHKDGGVFVAEGGWELVAVIAAAALALAGAGAGRLSVDGILGRRGRSLDERADGRAAPVGGTTRA